MILTKETLSAGPKIGTGEGVAHSKRWYVALVRMHHEKKVAERLDKMGIENFVPVQQEVHQWSDRRKVVESNDEYNEIMFLREITHTIIPLKVFAGELKGIQKQTILF